jgi:hypothetical protein
MISYYRIENMLNIDLINITKTPRYGQTLMSGLVLALKNGISFFNKVYCQNEPIKSRFNL